MELQEKIDVFEANEIGLLAISVDPTATAKQMKERNNLTFPLLSDVNRETIKAYDVLNAAANIAKPAVFVLDSAGGVAWKYVGADKADRPSADKVLEQALSLLGDPMSVSPKNRAASVWAELKSR